MQSARDCATQFIRDWVMDGGCSFGIARPLPAYVAMSVFHRSNSSPSWCHTPSRTGTGLGIPPKGTQLVRHAGLYARNVKAKWAEIANTALEVLRLQMPLFDLEPLATFFKTLTWRERITRACRQGR